MCTDSDSSIRGGSRSDDPLCAARILRYRELESRFVVASLRDGARAHDALGFYKLLYPTERRRLGSLFASELHRNPALPGSGPALRAAWDRRSRSYLGRVSEAADLVAHHRLVQVEHMSTRADLGALLLTVNGSIVVIGGLYEDGSRPFLYEPLRAHRASGLRDDGCLARDLRSGHRARIGSLRVSSVMMLAVRRRWPDDWDRLSEELALRRRRPAGASYFASARTRPEPDETTLADYQTRLDLLARADLDSGDRLVQECEALAALLLLHENAAARDRRYPVAQVSRLMTTSGTSYLVQTSPDAAGEVDLVRVPRDGKARRLERVHIFPLTVAIGAPVALFTRGHDGRDQISFTSPVIEVIAR